MKSKILKQYFSACEGIATEFQRKYFGMRDVSSYWVADDVGGVFAIQEDYFFNVSTMVDYLRYGYSKERMFEHYEYALECSLKGNPVINIKNYPKIKKVK